MKLEEMFPEKNRKRVPQIFDKIGRPLDRILILPLFGEGYEFFDIKAAIDFIGDTPEHVGKLQIGFVRFEITILFLDDHPENRHGFKTKNLAIDFLNLLFN